MRVDYTNLFVVGFFVVLTNLFWGAVLLGVLAPTVLHGQNASDRRSLILSSKKTAPNIVDYSGDSVKTILTRHLASRVPQEYDTLTVRLLTQTALAIYEHSIDSAEQYAERAQILAERLRDSTGLIAALAALSRIVRVHGQYSRSVEFALRSATIASARGDSLTLAESLNAAGNSYYWLGAYNVSLAYFFKSLALFERIKPISPELILRKSFNSMNIGRCYARQGMYAEGLQYQQRAIQMNPNSDLVRQYACENISVVCVQQARYDSALIYAQWSLRLLLKNEKKTIKGANIYEQIADCYKYLGKADSADRYLSEAEWRFAAVDDVRGLARVRIGQAEIALRRRQVSAALKFSSEALQMAEGIGAKRQQYEALQVMVGIYEKLGDSLSAYAQFRRAAAVKDSMISEISTLSATAMNALYEREQRQGEIEILKRDGQLKERKIIEERNVRLFLLTVAVMLLVVALVLSNRYRLKARSEEQIRFQNGQLAEQNTLLNLLNAEKNELLGIVSHDLKNPISAIRGLTDLVHSGFVEGEQVKDITEQVILTADRMLELVKNLLDINRLESGGIQMNSVQFDIIPMVEAVVWQYASQAEAKNITLHFQKEAKNSPVYADEQAMMQILDNLISNAVKYSPHEKNIYVRVKSSDNNVRVEVQDEGEGISPDDMKKLFGKFARLSARPTGGEHSTGLGLSIVKKMVEAMNGKVWCESEVGDGLPTGATFIVELPVASTLENPIVS